MRVRAIHHRPHPGQTTGVGSSHPRFSDGSTTGLGSLHYRDAGVNSALPPIGGATGPPLPPVGDRIMDELNRQIPWNTPDYPRKPGEYIPLDLLKLAGGPPRLSKGCSTGEGVRAVYGPSRAVSEGVCCATLCCDARHITDTSGAPLSLAASRIRGSSRDTPLAEPWQVEGVGVGGTGCRG